MSLLCMFDLINFDLGIPWEYAYILCINEILFVKNDGSLICINGEPTMELYVISLLSITDPSEALMSLSIVL